MKDYLLYVMENPEGDISKTGYIWCFIKIFERNKVNFLI